MKRQVHRVRVNRPAAPPLPKEVEPIGPRTYRDRFGIDLEIVWSGDRRDGYLCANVTDLAQEQPR